MRTLLMITVMALVLPAQASDVFGCREIAFDAAVEAAAFDDELPEKVVRGLAIITEESFNETYGSGYFVVPFIDTSYVVSVQGYTDSSDAPVSCEVTEVYVQ